MYPLWMYSAAFVWLIPLPRPCGKTNRVSTATTTPTSVGAINSRS